MAALDSAPTNEPSESVIVQLNELSGNIPAQFDMSVKDGSKVTSSLTI